MTASYTVLVNHIYEHSFYSMCLKCLSQKYTGCGKKDPLKFFGNISPTTENFKLKFYAPRPILCSYLCKITKLYSNISNFDKVKVELDRLVNFYISLEKHEKCDITATARPIFRKFNVIMQNVSLKKVAVENFNFKIPRCRTAAI